MRSTGIVAVLLSAALLGCQSNVKPAGAGPSTAAADASHAANTTVTPTTTPPPPTTTRTAHHGPTPLIDAIVDGKSVAQILEMIAVAADVNDRGGGRGTPLYYAAGRPDHWPDDSRGDAKWKAFRERRPMLPVVQALVERGADVNARCIGAMTPLHAACERGSPDVVAYLISKGADVNAKEHGGATPLHIAADREDDASGRDDLIAIIRCLVAHGADPNAVDNRRNTPRDWARARERGWGWTHGSADVLLGELAGKYGADLKAAQSQERGGKTP